MSSTAERWQRSESLSLALLRRERAHASKPGIGQLQVGRLARRRSSPTASAVSAAVTQQRGGAPRGGKVWFKDQGLFRNLRSAQQVRGDPENTISVNRAVRRGTVSLVGDGSGYD